MGLGELFGLKKRRLCGGVSCQRRICRVRLLEERAILGLGVWSERLDRTLPSIGVELSNMWGKCTHLLIMVWEEER